MGFLALLIPLLAQLPGLVGNFFKQKADLQAAQIETQRQLELARQQMASEIARTQMDLNKTIVNSTGSYFKYFTFIMWFGPFIVGVVWPSKAVDIFTNLAGMPQWYVESCMLIMFTVWGISVSAPVVSNIFTGLGDYLQSRRDFKLEKAKIDRKVFFDALRKVKGVLTQAEVDAENKVLDQLEKN